MKNILCLVCLIMSVGCVASKPQSKQLKLNPIKLHPIRGVDDVSRSNTAFTRSWQTQAQGWVCPYSSLDETHRRIYDENKNSSSKE